MSLLLLMLSLLVAAVLFVNIATQLRNIELDMLRISELLHDAFVTLARMCVHKFICMCVLCLTCLYSVGYVLLQQVCISLNWDFITGLLLLVAFTFFCPFLRERVC